MTNKTCVCTIVFTRRLSHTNASFVADFFLSSGTEVIIKEDMKAQGLTNAQSPAAKKLTTESTSSGLMDVPNTRIFQKKNSGNFFKK